MAKAVPKAEPQPAAPSASGTGADRRAAQIAGVLLFALALGVRLLFWQATPDRTWGWSAWLKGDAPVWLEYAQALQAGRPFELGLPIHPPGAAWLVAALWNGQLSGLALLRCAWAALGALVVVLAYAAALRSFGFGVALLAGLYCALSTGLLILSTSVNNETPYLVLVLLTLLLFADLRRRPGPVRLALWAALHAAACLVRVEHALFFALTALLLGVLWLREEPRAGVAPRLARRAAVVLAFFVLPLVPWHLKAWAGIQRFNSETRAMQPHEAAAVQGVEEALHWMTWTPEARRRRDELPAFLRRTTAVFVSATAAHRGGREVRAEDFGVLEEAFGYVPRPLGRFPFVSSYGPLNFYLANHPGATGGFDRGPLEEPPPLRGGAAHYPAFLVQGLPPEQLTFVYPPHLRLFNEGYALGWRAIFGRPAQFAALAWRKLDLFWSGAALGFTGYGWPLGLDGTRPAVDLVIPDSPWAGAWRVGLVLLCGLGAAAAWRQPVFLAWLLFLAGKITVTVLFFGYARQGATVVPVVALLVALAVMRWIAPRLPALGPRRALVAGAVVVLLFGGVETARYLAPPQVTIDGWSVGAGDVTPADLHRRQRIGVR